MKPEDETKIKNLLSEYREIHFIKLIDIFGWSYEMARRQAVEFAARNKELVEYVRGVLRLKKVIK